MQILPLRYAQGQDDSALGQLIARRICDLGRIVADSSVTNGSHYVVTGPLR